MESGGISIQVGGRELAIRNTEAIGVRRTSQPAPVVESKPAPVLTIPVNLNGPDRQSYRAAAAAYMAVHHPEWREPVPVKPLPATLPMPVGHAIMRNGGAEVVASGYDPSAGS